MKLKELIKEVERLQRKIINGCSCKLCEMMRQRIEGIKQTVEVVDNLYLDYQLNLTGLYAQTDLLKAQKKGESMMVNKLRDNKDWQKLKELLGIK